MCHSVTALLYLNTMFSLVKQISGKPIGFFLRCVCKQFIDIVLFDNSELLQVKHQLHIICINAELYRIFAKRNNYFRFKDFLIALL